MNEPIFHQGAWQLKEVRPEDDNTAEYIISYLWKLGESVRLVAVNLNQHPAQGRINLTEIVSEKEDYSGYEVFSENNERFSGVLLCHPGLILKLSGYQAQIWEIEKYPPLGK